MEIGLKGLRPLPRQLNRWLEELTVAKIVLVFLLMLVILVSGQAIRYQRTSYLEKYRRVDLGMTWPEVEAILKQGRVEYHVYRSNETSFQRCSFSDPWRSYVITLEGEPLVVVEKSCAFNN